MLHHPVIIGDNATVEDIDRAIEVARHRRALTELPSVFEDLTDLIDELLERRLTAPA